jgi:hypothetical protein
MEDASFCLFSLRIRPLVFPFVRVPGTQGSSLEVLSQDRSYLRDCNQDCRLKGAASGAIRCQPSFRFERENKLVQGFQIVHVIERLEIYRAQNCDQRLGTSLVQGCVQSP